MVRVKLGDLVGLHRETVRVWLVRLYWLSEPVLEKDHEGVPEGEQGKVPVSDRERVALGLSLTVASCERVQEEPVSVPKLAVSEGE